MDIKSEIWRQWGQFSLTYPESWSGLILLAFYLVLLARFLFLRRDDFKRMDAKAWLAFAFTLLGLLLANTTFVLSQNTRSAILITPVSVLRSPPTLSLLALFLVSALSLWLGAGPGALAGIFAGVTSAWVYPQILIDTFAWAAWGAALGSLWQQPYRGKVFDFLRLPLIVPLSATLGPLLVLSLNRLIESIHLSTLLMIDYATAPIRDAGLIWLLNGLVQGIIFTLLFWLWPRLRPVQRSDKSSVFRRSVRARLMIALVPLLILSIFFSIMAVTQKAVSLAREQALGEMARSAETAASGLANFYYTGSNLLEEFSASLASGPPEERASLLRTDRRVVPFFPRTLVGE